MGPEVPTKPGGLGKLDVHGEPGIKGKPESQGKPEGQGKPDGQSKPEGQGKPNENTPEKTSTRDGHSVSEKENQMLKPEHGKGGKPKEYTEAEFKEHLKTKIAKKLENIKTCNTQIDEIKSSEWSKFEKVAAQELELKITLHLMHFCMKDGKDMKKTVEELADKVKTDGATSETTAKEAESVMNNQIVQLESKSISCTSEDLFCNVAEEQRQETSQTTGQSSSSSKNILVAG